MCFTCLLYLQQQELLHTNWWWSCDQSFEQVRKEYIIMNNVLFVNSIAITTSSLLLTKEVSQAVRPETVSLWLKCVWEEKKQNRNQNHNIRTRTWTHEFQIVHFRIASYKNNLGKFTFNQFSYIPLNIDTQMSACRWQKCAKSVCDSQKLNSMEWVTSVHKNEMMTSESFLTTGCQLG